MLKNIEAKVVAAAYGAGAGGASGGAIGTFLLWLLGVTVWGQPNDAKHATDAISAVPEPVGGFLVIVLAAILAVVGAVAAGYQAPHTERPDLHLQADQVLHQTVLVPVDDEPAAASSGATSDPVPDSTATAQPIPGSQPVVNATSVTPDAAANSAGTVPLSVTVPSTPPMAGTQQSTVPYVSTNPSAAS